MFVLHQLQQLAESLALLQGDEGVREWGAQTPLLARPRKGHDLCWGSSPILVRQPPLGWNTPKSTGCRLESQPRYPWVRNCANCLAPADQGQRRAQLAPLTRALTKMKSLRWVLSFSFSKTMPSLFCTR